MKRSVWIVNPTVNNSCFIIALVAISVLVTEGNVSGNVSISECSQSGGQAQRQGHIPDDGQPVNFTCENIPINEAVFWVLKQNGNVNISLKCDSPSQPCNTNPDFQVSRGNETSVLTVVHNHQRWLVTSTVICSVGDGTSNVYTCIVKFASTAVTTQGTATTVLSTSSTAGVHPSSTQDPVSSTSSPNGPSRGSTSISSTTPQTPTGEKDDGVPIAAIAGGAAAFLVIIIIIIIIVVVVVVRRRTRQKKAHADNNVLGEQVNPMYGSGDEPETASPSSSKPSGIALRIPTDTSNNAATIEDADNTIDAGYSSMAFGEQQTTSPASATSPTGQSSPNTASQPGFPTNTTTPGIVTDADLYTAVDGMEQEQTSGPVQDHAAGYSTVGGPNNSATTAPSGDVYAVVQKSGPRAQSASATTTVSPSNPGDSADGAYAFVDVSRSSAPASSASIATSGDPVSDNADNAYAVVNKSSSQGKGTGASTTPDTSNSTRQVPSGDVYAQVDKSSKRNASTRENDGEGQSNVYAQVDKGNNSTPVQQTQAQDEKPNPGTKPKPALKPKPSSDA